MFVLLFAPLAGRAALDGARAACILEVEARKLAAAAGRLAPGDYPKSISGSTWTTIPAGDLLGWTQGFFPGSMWLLAEATGDAAWRARAEAWTSPLAVQRTNTASHDLGFKFVPSFGRMFQVPADADAARAVLLRAAASLDSRYSGTVGAVKCCDWNPDWTFPVVVDTMMNLELLFWAAANGGDLALRDAALHHALTTARDLVRDDGGTFHVADYDPATGSLRARMTFQGAGTDTTWSRGEAWALYGFATAFRYTGDVRMLAAARKVAGYWLAHVPTDGVPNWDFDSSLAAKDSSAAAAGASGLLALAAQVDGAERAQYEAAALAALQSLGSSAYLDEGSSEALLLHGVGDLPHGKEVDVGLVYGDYYFLEALLRAFPGPLGACSSTPNPSTPTTPEPAPTPEPGGGPTALSRSGGCGSAGEMGIAAALVAALALGVRRIARR